MAITKVSAALVDLDGGVVINESSADADFRVESNGNANMLFVNGGTDSVGIGTASPEGLFEIEDGGTGKSILQKITLDNDDVYGLVVGNDSYSTTLADGFAVTVGNSGLVGLQARGTGSELAFRTVGAERVRIDSSGNVGIGTASPNASLDVVSDSSANGIELRGRSSDNIGQLTFESNDSGTTYSQLQSRSTELFVKTVANIPMSFHTNNTERLRIDSSGNVLVGKTDTALSSAGIQLSSVGGFNVTRDDGNLTNFNRKSTHGSIMEFYKDGSSVGTISTNSNSLPSDRNYKKDIADLNIGLDLVKKLEPKQYRYKHDEDSIPVMYGIIAQDLETSLTEVGVTKNSTWLLQHEPTEDEKKSDYSLDYTKLTPVLIKAIQEQQTIIEDLKTRIETLEG